MPGMGVERSSGERSSSVGQGTIGRRRGDFPGEGERGQHGKEARGVE